MQFELSEALLDDILFSMEDQDMTFFIDTLEVVVITLEDAEEFTDKDNDERFISLPDWDSSSGFRLMERFAAAIRNPLIRDELCTALKQGKGVFRAFKNAISKHPEAEKLWFSFKEKEMKREIIRWYNGLRAEWGLKKIGFEPEETTDLILEDFRFREFSGKDREAARDLHITINENAEPDFTDEVNDESAPYLPFKNSFLDADLWLEKPLNKWSGLVAETGAGEFAGFVSAEHINENLYIRVLEVKPEYRGLGIGKALLGNFLKATKSSGALWVCIDLPVQAEDFSRVLIREGFSPIQTQYCLKIQELI